MSSGRARLENFLIVESCLFAYLWAKVVATELVFDGFAATVDDGLQPNALDTAVRRQLVGSSSSQELLVVKGPPWSFEMPGLARPRCM